MTCSAMLDQILEADLDVLEGAGDSDLARHVRECVRCRAIARRIVGDTRSLGQAVADARTTTMKVAPITGVPTVRRLNGGRIAVIVGLAAALCVVVAREWARRRVMPHEASQVAAVEVRSAKTSNLLMPPATVVAARPRVGHVRRDQSQRVADNEARDLPPRADRAAPQVVATAAERTVVKPLDLPSAVAPVRLDTSSSVVLGGAVTVDPPSGVRANIIRTPNPAVTVVWLYQ